MGPFGLLRVALGFCGLPWVAVGVAVGRCALLWVAAVCWVFLCLWLWLWLWPSVAVGCFGCGDCTAYAALHFEMKVKMCCAFRFSTIQVYRPPGGTVELQSPRGIYSVFVIFD